jgi:hypothetical protein
MDLPRSCSTDDLPEGWSVEQRYARRAGSQRRQGYASGGLMPGEGASLRRFLVYGTTDDFWEKSAPRRKMPVPASARRAERCGDRRRARRARASIRRCSRHALPPPGRKVNGHVGPSRHLTHSSGSPTQPILHGCFCFCVWGHSYKHIAITAAFVRVVIKAGVCGFV